MNVSGVLREQARRAPAAPALLRATGEAVTYGELERTVDALARELAAGGLVPGQVAAVAIPDLYRYLAVTLALARIGVAHGPLSLPPSAIGVALVEGGVAGAALVPKLDVRALWLAAATGDAPPMPLAEGGARMVKLCPSSGTTGAQKFVVMSHELALRRAELRLGEDQGVAAERPPAPLRQACLIDPVSSYGFTSNLMVLRCGGTIVEPDLDAASLAAWLVRSGVNKLILAPIALRKMLAVLPPLRAANALAVVELGGGLVSPADCALAEARLCPNIRVRYGSSESGAIAGGPARGLVHVAGAVGFVQAGVEVRILADDGREAGPGETGAIAVRSERNASQYFEAPALSAAVFRDGWVYTGDRGLVEPGGLLRLLGRMDDVINQGGNKIDPQFLEDAMLALGDVREAAVFGVSLDDGEVCVCAAIVPVRPLDAESYHARCRERLGANAPVFIMHMQELPRNPAGKVLRHELARVAREAERSRRERH